MTLEELAATLPNGFHDSSFKTIFVDYERHRATFGLELLVGTPDANDRAAMERVRDADLTLEGLQFLVLQRPDPREPVGEGYGADLIQAERLPDSLKNSPDGCFVSGFFVNGWNASVYVSAKSASLKWK